MKDELISFETAKLAKEKGFKPEEEWNPTYVNGYIYDEDTDTFKFRAFKEENWSIEDHYLAPTQSLLQRWLRENKFISVIIKHYSAGTFSYEISTYSKVEWEKSTGFMTKSFYKYEEALEEGLLEGLKLIKDEKE